VRGGRGRFGVRRAGIGRSEMGLDDVIGDVW